jgi:copper(I)-binding protein
MNFRVWVIAAMVVLGTASALVLAPAFAQYAGAVPAGITIDQGWTRMSTAPGKTTPAYFRIHNAGAAPDTLVSTTCPIAHHTLLLDQAGQQLGAIVIKPGQTLTLTPKALHLMLQDNRFRFYAHAMIPCSVDFLDAGKLILYLHVEPDSADGYQQARRSIVRN